MLQFPTRHQTIISIMDNVTILNKSIHLSILLCCAKFQMSGFKIMPFYYTVTFRVRCIWIATTFSAMQRYINVWIWKRNWKTLVTSQHLFQWTFAGSIKCEERRNLHESSVEFALHHKRTQLNYTWSVHDWKMENVQHVNESQSHCLVA